MALVDDQPLLAEYAATPVAPLTSLERTLVLTNASLVDAIMAAVPSLPRDNIVAEPHPAGTAAALTYAAAVIARRAGPEAVMLCVHADWAIGDAAAFRATLSRAAAVAEREHGLVTVGIVPTRPDPGFGYIEPGPPVHLEADDGRRGAAACHVSRFIEKPTRERAAEMCRTGYLWNSGIFVWRVGDFLDEVHAHTPEVAPALATLTRGKAYSIRHRDVLRRGTVHFRGRWRTGTERQNFRHSGRFRLGRCGNVGGARPRTNRR